MKQCSKCKELKDESEFAFKNKAKGWRASNCKTCQKVMARSWYENNCVEHKKVTLENSQRYRERNREFIRSLNLECQECGEDHPACMDFHHRDPSDKEYSVSVLVGTAMSIEAIKAEIEKCDVLCANCHRKFHWNERNNGPLAQ